MIELAAVGRRMREEDGHTLVELLAAIVLTTLVLGATLNGLDDVGSIVRVNDLQNESQDRARMGLEVVAHELRNASGPQTGLAHGIEKAQGTDLVFRVPG